MTAEELAVLTRIAIALESIAAKPVALPTAWVWDEAAKAWKMPNEYEAGRNAP